MKKPSTPIWKKFVYKLRILKLNPFILFLFFVVHSQISATPTSYYCVNQNTSRKIIVCPHGLGIIYCSEPITQICVLQRILLQYWHSIISLEYNYSLFYLKLFQIHILSSEICNDVLSKLHLLVIQTLKKPTFRQK